jgi:anti-sigma B factor antagonist
MGDCTHPQHGRIHVETVADGQATRITLRGEVDFATSADLDAALAAVELDGTRQVQLDVADLGFVDVAGLRQLSSFARQLRETGYDVATYGAQPMVDEVARLAGVHDDLGLA